MVTERDQLLIVQPNCSASWQQNRRLLLLLTAWILLVSISFALAGAWVIIPFAGLEIAALAATLYYACWKLHHRHVIRFDDQQIIIEKGVYYPKQRWVLPQNKTFLSVQLPTQQQGSKKLFICSDQAVIAVGDFLNKSDSEQLITQLKNRGLMTRNYSAEDSIAA